MSKDFFSEKKNFQEKFLMNFLLFLREKNKDSFFFKNLEKNFHLKKSPDVS